MEIRNIYIDNFPVSGTFVPRTDMDGYYNTKNWDSRLLGSNMYNRRQVFIKEPRGGIRAPFDGICEGGIYYYGIYLTFTNDKEIKLGIRLFIAHFEFSTFDDPRLIAECNNYYTKIIKSSRDDNVYFDNKIQVKKGEKIAYVTSDYEKKNNLFATVEVYTNYIESPYQQDIVTFNLNGVMDGKEITPLFSGDVVRDSRNVKTCEGTMSDITVETHSKWITE